MSLQRRERSFACVRCTSPRHLSEMLLTITASSSTVIALIMTKAQSSKPTAIFRYLAMGTLLVWVSALVLCSTHCSVGCGHEDASHASCDGVAVSDSHGDDDQSGAPSDEDSQTSYACGLLKSGLSSGQAHARVVQPELPLLYVLPPFFALLESARNMSEATLFRQGRPCDWVFTPEVYLGPAFRSLAPPVLL